MAQETTKHEETIIQSEFTTDTGDKYKTVTRTVTNTRDSGLDEALMVLLKFFLAGLFMWMSFAFVLSLTRSMNQQSTHYEMRTNGN